MRVRIYDQHCPCLQAFRISFLRFIINLNQGLHPNYHAASKVLWGLSIDVFVNFNTPAGIAGVVGCGCGHVMCGLLGLSVSEKIRRPAAKYVLVGRSPMACINL